MARRLALALAGSWAPLVKSVGPAETAEADLDALAEAAATAQDRLGDVNAARAIMTRAFGAAKEENADTLPYLVERLLEIDDGHAPDVYRTKLVGARRRRRRGGARGDAVPARGRARAGGRRRRSGRAGQRADRGRPTGGARTSARCWRGARARGSRPSAASGRARPRRGSSWRAWRDRRRGRTPICAGRPSCGTRASATRRGPRCSTRRLHMAAPADAAVAMVLGAPAHPARRGVGGGARARDDRARARAGGRGAGGAGGAGERDRRRVGGDDDRALARGGRGVGAARRARGAGARVPTGARSGGAAGDLRAAGHGAERRRAARRDLLRDRGRAGARGGRSERGGVGVQRGGRSRSG